MDTEFIRIRETVRVGVLVAVNDSIAIRVSGQRFSSQDINFVTVIEPIVVGICHFGVGFVDWPRAIPYVL